MGSEAGRIRGQVTGVSVLRGIALAIMGSTHGGRTLPQTMTGAKELRFRAGNSHRLAWLPWASSLLVNQMLSRPADNNHMGLQRRAKARCVPGDYILFPIQDDARRARDLLGRFTLI